MHYVKKQGGSVVEAYTVEPGKDKMPEVFAWTGLASPFAKAALSNVPAALKPDPSCDSISRINDIT